jgi:integrase
MAKIPSPFKYRGGWRAQVTLKSGTRPHADFDKHGEAKDWITDQLVNHNSENDPLIGGPKMATLAQALFLYAGMYTIVKGGRDAEIDRINHYLVGAGIKAQRFVNEEGSQLRMEERPIKALPSAFKAHLDKRLVKRVRTYEMIAQLANRRVSTLITADFRQLMVCMKAEGLSDSTIQKEVALLKHMFNMAANEWNWQGFRNPCVGLKLKGSNMRFVVITAEQKSALRAALAQCDSPYFWPMVEIVVETTLRKGSLLEMSRENVDLEGRIAHLMGKGRMFNIPLSLKTIEILKGLPAHPSGKYFPMSSNAVDQAWDGVRTKIGMPKLQFRDLRHVGATGYARTGMNSHQLMVQLGHTSTRMSDIYCNLVAQDSLDALDRIAKTQPVFELPPPANGSAEKILGRNRAQRLANAILAKVKAVDEVNDTNKVELPPEQTQGKMPLDATALFMRSNSPNESTNGASQPTKDLGTTDPSPAQTDSPQPVLGPLGTQLAPEEAKPVEASSAGATSSDLLDESLSRQATGTHDGAREHDAPAQPKRSISNVVSVNFRRPR